MKRRAPLQNPDVEAEVARERMTPFSDPQKRAEALANSPEAAEEEASERLGEAEAPTSRSVRIASSPDEEADEAERSLEGPKRRTGSLDADETRD